LLIAPSARHRARFRAGDKHWLVVTGSRLTLAGLGCLGLAMTGAILLVTDVVFSRITAIVAGGTLVLLLGWFWFGAPLLRARND
jgi:hypothetical protein